MLTDAVERYLSLRQTLGHKLRGAGAHLRAFAHFAVATGDVHVRTATAMEWAKQARSPNARHIWLRDVSALARFLHAEDSAHEVPPRIFHAAKSRPRPYIYTPEEIERLIEAAGRLRQTRAYPMRRWVYTTLIGLIASTGLRISEALNLEFDDMLPGGVLRIRRTKFGKSRLVPLHPTVTEALDRYLDVRRTVAATKHVFLSASRRRISGSMVRYTFRRMLRLAEIACGRTRQPRIHDLRHTFATRALEQCATRREAVARHFVALSTYLGHGDIKATYWYLEATPEMMIGIATAAEGLVAGRGV